MVTATLVGKTSIDIQKYMAAIGFDSKSIIAEKRTYTEAGAWVRCQMDLAGKSHSLRGIFVFKIDLHTLARLARNRWFPTFTLTDEISVWDRDIDFWHEFAVACCGTQQNIDPHDLALQELGSQVYEQLQNYAREYFNGYRCISSGPGRYTLQKINS